MAVDVARSRIADPSLAPVGEQRIAWVARHSPVLNSLARARLADGALRGRREQVALELLLRGAVGRVHLDPARDERGRDRVLRRAGIRSRGDHLGARLGKEQREVGRLRLEVDDDGDPAAAQGAVP